jgi:hypothetical protein
MKNLYVEKQTIDFERKMYYKNNRKTNKTQKVLNLKRAVLFGHVKDDIEKYGLKQCMERSEDFEEIFA